LANPNSDKTGKPIAQTFVTELRDTFTLACDNANQFRDYLLGCWRTRRLVRDLLFGVGYKYSYLLTSLPSTRVLEKIIDRVLEQ